MRRAVPLRGAALCVAALFLLGFPRLAGADATVTQTFQLSPGWNAIFLAVQPEPDNPATLFAELPVDSVWTFFQPASSVQFIQNPDEQQWNREAWGAYFQIPEKAHLTNLFAVPGGRAYLVKLAGTEPVTWTVSGRPHTRDQVWASDSFNLVGFRTDPAAPPTFADYLAPSTAHAGQAIFRLGDSGDWEFVDAPGSEPVRPGTAYWVYCAGASRYQGPLEIQLPGLAGLDFGPYQNTLTVALHNRSDQARTVSVVPLTAAVDLAYRTFDSATGIFEWPPLAGMPGFTVGPGGWHNLRIAVRRETLAAERAESVVRISDDLGTQLLVPVFVEKEE
jgi:hypothetical protein